MQQERMDPGLRRVIERFPEHATLTQARFHDDQNFREMCSDYAETLEALQRWQASDGAHKEARIEEYRELAAALESEILAALRLPTRPKDDHQS
jgi:hypothetical protein